MSTAQKMMQTFTREGKKYYYIHRHISHFEASEAITTFNKQKEKNFSKMKRRYKQNYLKNIRLTDEQGRLLDLSARGDSVISNIDSYILESLNTEVAKNIDKEAFLENVSKAYTNIDNFKNSKDIKFLDDVFGGIEKAATLLEDYLPELSVILGQSNWIKSGRDLGRLNQLISNEINKMKNKSISISNNRQAQLLSLLQTLVINLQNENVSKETLKSSLRNIFSTNLGEYYVSKAFAKAYDLAVEAVEKSLQGTSSTKKSIKLDKSLEKYRQQGATVYKVDNQFKNIQIEISEKKETITANLGISTKWYSSSNSNKLYSVDITNETSFMWRVKQILTLKNHYLAYNAIALRNQNQAVYQALINAVISSVTDFLISGLGVGGDFAQFIVINGEFFSIWDIIKSIETAAKNKEDVEGKFFKRDSVISISAQGSSKIADMTDQARKYKPNLTKAYERAKQTNEEIDDLELIGSFYPTRAKKLKAALSK